jgi:predicted dinucleotide-binding enzyme
MKIGIIGTGTMGRVLGLGWVGAGHQVMFGSRDLAKARVVAAAGGSLAQAGDFDDAAAFGQVVLYTVRDLLPSRLLRTPEALIGKVVIDCNNRDLGDDRRPADFCFDVPPPVPSFSERLAADAPGARVVKAFNTVSHRVIELGRETLAPQGVSVFLCSNDAAAKATIKELAEELGFVGVDSGGLERAWLVDAVADFIRFQIGAMGLGLLATISVRILPEIQRGPEGRT